MPVQPRDPTGGDGGGGAHPSPKKLAQLEIANLKKALDHLAQTVNNIKEVKSVTIVPKPKAKAAKA
jgi:hypothetical protein